MKSRLIFWGNIAICFLLRSGRITAALSLMVITAVAVLIFLSALAVGVNDTMIRNSVGLYSGHISGEELPMSLPPDRLRMDGVATVLKRVYSPGILSREQTVLPITAAGVDPAAEKEVTALWKKVVAGAYPEEGKAEILLSRSMAEKLNVQPGDPLDYRPLPDGSPVTLTVSGIFHTGIDTLDQNLAFCPAGVLENAGKTWQAAIFLKEGSDPDAVVADYRNRLSGVGRFQTWKEAMPDLVQLIELNYVSMGIVLILVFGVVSLGIACAFVIFIFRNLREYGIMKAMGVTSGEMAGLLILNVVLMNLAGCLAGLLIGVAAVLTANAWGIDLTAFTSHNRYFTVSGIIYPRLTRFSLWLPLALSLVFSLIAALWPAILVNRKKAADILRIV